jgi:DNA repair exonuclease SbcCD nuclease subunit
MLFDPTTKLVGDPHLGRQFISGVPLDRRGEREQLVWDDFIAAINTPNMKRVVIVGDLFNGFIVPFEIILRTSEALDEASKDGREIVVMDGNHDSVRDADKKSAFDLLVALLSSNERIKFVTREPLLIDDLVFFPWHPFHSATTVVEHFITRHPNTRVRAAFGHWDVGDFGQINPNLIPFDLLASITDTIYTGHIHTPSVHRRGKTVLHVVGSLQPYSHSEDPTERFYVTLGLDELDPKTDYSMKCVRLRLKADEAEPENFNCLQLTIQRLDPEGRVIDDEKVELGNFDLFSIFHESMDKHQVEPATRELVLTKFEEFRNGR